MSLTSWLSIFFEADTLYLGDKRVNYGVNSCNRLIIQNIYRCNFDKCKVLLSILQKPSKKVSLTLRRRHF